MRTLLRDPRYLAFWLGQATSVLGSGMALVALPALVLPHHGARGFGLVLAASSAAAAVLLLVAGVLADRYSRTAVMAVSDVLRMGAVSGYLLLGGDAPLPTLMALSVLVGAGSALHQPAHRAALPQVVPPALIQQANAVDATTRQLGFGAGAAVGGVVVAAWGPAPAFVVDLVTFAVSLVTLLWLRLPPVGEAAAGGGTRAVLLELREGVTEVRRRPWVAVVMLQGTVQVFCLFAPALALVPVVATDRYGDGSYGWLSATGLLGMSAGSALAARLRPRRPGLVAMNALAPCTLIPLTLAVEVPLWAMCAGTFLAWVGIGVFIVLWFSALQKEFPPRVQGRVFSLESLMTFGLEPVALAVTPALAVAVGLTPLAAVAVVVMLVSTYAVLLVPGVARFRSPDGSSPPQEPFDVREVLGGVEVEAGGGRHGYVEQPQGRE